MLGVDSMYPISSAVDSLPRAAFRMLMLATYTRRCVIFFFFVFVDCNLNLKFVFEFEFEFNVSFSGISFNTFDQTL